MRVRGKQLGILVDARQCSGFTLIQLLLILSASTLLFMAVESTTKTDSYYKEVTNIAAKVEALRDAAYFYYRMQGKWPYDAVGAECQGGSDSDMDWLPGGLSKNGWGDFLFDCTEAGDVYKVRYDVPIGWEAYLVNSVSETTVIVTGGLMSTMESKIYRSGINTGIIEIIEPQELQPTGNGANKKLEATLIPLDCTGASAKWLYSVDAMCGESNDDNFGFSQRWTFFSGFNVEVDNVMPGNGKRFSVRYSSSRAKVGVFILPPNLRITGWENENNNRGLIDCGLPGAAKPRVSAIVQCY